MKRRVFYSLIILVLLPFFVLAQGSNSVLQKAIAHISSVQHESGAWSRLKGEFPFEAEPTSWAVKVLAMNGIEPERVKKGIEFILKDQKIDGSWNNNTAHTAFAIIALREAGYKNGAIERGIEYLRKVQAEEGGYMRINKEGDPLTIYTAVVLCAMKDAGLKKEDATVKKALDWLTSCQNQDGGFGMRKNAPSLAMSTAWTIRALLAYGYSPDTEMIKKAVEWLKKTQKPSGGFAANPEAKEDPEITAYVILGLNKIKDVRERLLLAKSYLERVQETDGSFISATPIQFNKVPKKNTQTTCFVAWALSELK